MRMGGDRQLRVLVASHVGDLDGGAERSLLALLAGLCERGHHVDAVVPTSGALASALRDAGVAAHLGPLPRWAPWRDDPLVRPAHDPLGHRARRAGGVAARVARSVPPALDRCRRRSTGAVSCAPTWC